MHQEAMTAVWRPIRAFTALLVTVTALGGIASATALTFLVGALLYNTGGLIFHLSVIGMKILGAIALATMILTSAVLGVLRPVQA